MTSGSCVVSFAGSQVTIEWMGETAGSILKFLYPKMHCGPKAGKTARIEARADGADEEIVVRSGEKDLYRGSCAGTAAVALMRWSVYELAYDCRAGLLFHAAAFSLRGNGVLFPAMSGSGKSTLGAWLAYNAFDYLTDELVCVAQENLELDAFSRPIHLKGTSASVLEDLGCLVPFDVADTDARGLRSERGRLVSASLLNPSNAVSRPELRLIVFPKYESAAPLRAVRLSKAQAGLQLMRHLLNARNLAEHGFADITHMAQHVPAYALSYPSFDTVIETLEEMLSLD